jgi:hypothetical protein
MCGVLTRPPKGQSTDHFLCRDDTLTVDSNAYRAHASHSSLTKATRDKMDGKWRAHTDSLPSRTMHHDSLLQAKTRPRRDMYL